MPKLPYREPVNTAPTILVVSCWSLHKSQYCTKSSAHRNGRVALSRSDHHQMEVHWFPLMDTRETYVSVIISSCDFWQTLILLAGSGKSVIWFVFSDILPDATYFSSAPPSSKTSWLYAKPDPPSWPIFTSTSRTSESKPVTTFCFHLYPNFLLAPVFVVEFSTMFTRNMTKVHDSRVTTL